MISKRFDYKNKDEFINDLNLASKKLEYSEDLSSLIESYILKDIKIPNRMVSLPMEGQDAVDGTPSELTFHKYERIARGGYGIVWLEAVSVNEQGKSNDNQLYIREDNLSEFSKLNDNIKSAGLESEFKERPFTILQINHSGRYANKNGKANPTIMTHRKELDEKRGIPNDFDLVKDHELDNLINEYVSAARLVKKAGFDAIDVKACHGYLLSESLGAFDRDGSYGGSFENRTKLMLDVVKAIKNDKECEGLIIASRLNASDYLTGPWGIDRESNNICLDETYRLINELIEAGVEIFALTMGNPYFMPSINKPSNLSKDEKGPTPMEACSLLIETIADIQAKFPNIPFVNVGYSWMRDYGANVAAADIKAKRTSFAGFGRAGIAYADMPNDIKINNKAYENKACIACNLCSKLKSKGYIAGCVVREKEIYHKYVVEMNEALKE